MGKLEFVFIALAGVLAATPAWAEHGSPAPSAPPPPQTSPVQPHQFATLRSNVLDMLRLGREDQAFRFLDEIVETPNQWECDHEEWRERRHALIDELLQSPNLTGLVLVHYRERHREASNALYHAAGTGTATDLGKLREVIDRYPLSDAAMMAMQRLARLALERGEYTASAALYESLDRRWGAIAGIVRDNRLRFTRPQDFYRYAFALNRAPAGFSDEEKNLARRSAFEMTLSPQTEILVGGQTLRGEGLTQALAQSHGPMTAQTSAQVTAWLAANRANGGSTATGPAHALSEAALALNPNRMIPLVREVVRPGLERSVPDLAAFDSRIPVELACHPDLRLARHFTELPVYLNPIPADLARRARSLPYGYHVWSSQPALLDEALPGMRALQLKGEITPSVLQAIARHPGLRLVSLSRMPATADLSVLRALPELQSLAVPDITPEQAEQVATFPHLRALRASNLYGARALAALGNAPELEELHITAKKDTKQTAQAEVPPLDLRGLESWPHPERLRALSVEGAEVNEPVERQLARLIGLRSLSLRSASLSNLGFLRSMPHLTDLDLAAHRGLDGGVFSRLQALSPGLQSLNLSVTGLDGGTVLPAGTLIQLRALDVSSTSVGKPFLVSLAQLPHLESLNIATTSIDTTDEQVIAGLRALHLKTLMLSANQLPEEGGMPALQRLLPGVTIELGGK